MSPGRPGLSWMGSRQGNGSVTLRDLVEAGDLQFLRVDLALNFSPLTTEEAGASPSFATPLEQAKTSGNPTEVTAEL